MSFHCRAKSKLRSWAFPPRLFPVVVHSSRCTSYVDRNFRKRVSANLSSDRQCDTNPCWWPPELPAAEFPDRQCGPGHSRHQQESNLSVQLRRRSEEHTSELQSLAY